MKHRMRLVVAAFAVALTLGAATSKATDMLSEFNKAVLDWCETRGGSFMLPVTGAPGCKLGNEFWAGALRLVEEDAAWWWGKRTGMGDLHFGILWYIASPEPKQLCAASGGALCLCHVGLAALDNPAKVPVVLIGPGAGECASP